MPELIGGRYRVRREVGRGGMGAVWLCEDQVLRRQVAVKQVGLLPGESVTDSARALREARTSAALSHRNVVTVFDVVEEAGTIYLVMEYVPSRSLAELMREEGPLDPGRVAAIGAQVADGLAAAHAAGITHRDVKPGNVLVTEDGTAKISDFGIARTATEPTLTQSGFVTGTPAYFSPELARGAQPGPATDVWALGATLYAAVEGRPLYESRTNPVAALNDIATTLPSRPGRAGALEQPLMRMLDRDPGSRWSMATATQSLHKVADRLSADGTRSYTHEPLPVESPAPVAPARSGPPPSPAGGCSRRRWVRYLAVAAVVLAVAGGVAAAVQLGDAQGTGPSQAAGTHPPHPSAATHPAHPSAGTHSSHPSAGTRPTGRPRHRHTDGAGHAQPPPPGGKARFLRSYYSTVPENLDAGWSMLGPHEKSVGRASYDDFWGSMASVDVSRIVTSPGSHTVGVTLTYHYQDGRVVVERQRLTLIRHAGRWLIDDDTVLRSRTL